VAVSARNPVGRPPTRPLIITPFGSMLRQLRVDAGLSQNALARDAGIDPSYVNRCERGSRSPSRQVVLSLSRALDCTDVNRDALLIAAEDALARLRAGGAP
jgi:transcriptional regulator with XRE-family HTH domain